MKQRIRRRHRLDKGMRGWIVNHAKRNHWRVASWMDVEDLIQDGFVCYAKCVDRYGSNLAQPHLMALVKVSFANHVHNLAAKRTKAIDLTLGDDAMTAGTFARPGYLREGEEFEGGSEVLEVREGVEPEEGTLASLMRSLPRELSELLNTLMGDARELAEQLPRETTNAWLCRIAGLPAGRYDVEGTLRRHLGLEETLPAKKGPRPLFYVEGRLFAR